MARPGGRALSEDSVQVPLSGNAPYANAKVWSLERMQSAAAHRFLVVSDSDVSVTPGYLRAVMAPFADERVGLVTCLYRGVAGNSLWSQLEAVGMSIEMSAGVLVAEMLEGMKFALGPTMVVRRDCLEGAGGFRALGPYHADDFMLGNLIAASGHQVILSTHTIDHHVLNSSFLPSVLHQIRWMKSTRFSRPKGHFGTALTFSMPYGLLAAGVAVALHRPLLGGAVPVLELGIAGGAGLAGGPPGGRRAQALAQRAALSSARPAGLLLLDRELREQPGAVARGSLQPAAGWAHAQ